jgi:hypothetical protein
MRVPVHVKANSAQCRPEKKGECTKGETREPHYSARASLLRLQTMPVCFLELNPNRS